MDRPQDDKDRTGFSGNQVEITLRDARTGKLRTVQTASESLDQGDWYRRPKRELWERDDRQRRLRRVLIECDQRQGPRAGERDPDELDPRFLAALWQRYYR